MHVRPATPEEIASWDSLVAASPDGGNIFSSRLYAEQKQEQGGYTPHFLLVGSHPVTVLEKNAAPFGRYWYLPKGPNVTSTDDFFAINKALADYANTKQVFVIRTESELDRSYRPLLIKDGYRPSRSIIPNPSTIVLDISSDKETLLTQLPQKGRHAIRRAQRDGVVAKAVEATPENCRIMFELLQKTAEGKFGMRPYRYYTSFWQRFQHAGHGQLFFAFVGETVVAGAYGLILGHKSTYKDGASVRDRPAYGASHLLQWTLIQWAKEHGATLHDFCGSPPSDEIENTAHPHYGIGRFKLSFSRHVVDYIGGNDLVLKPFAYALWVKIGERLYHRFHFQRTKDYYY